MSDDPSEVSKMNTPWTIRMVVIGFAISLSSALISLSPRFRLYGSAGFIGASLCLANVRYVDGRMRKLAILGVIFGLGAFLAAYVWLSVLTGESDLLY